MTITLFKTSATIRSAQAEDRQSLANLIHFEEHVHRHLDWRGPLDWIGSQPYLVYEQRKQLLAALACPPDPGSVAWVRLFAVSHGLAVERAWDSLWTEALEQLKNLPETRAVTALALWPWFSQLLEGCGFHHENQVVMLSWEGLNPQVEQIARGFLIRPMNFDDIDDVHSVDLAAFNPIWQNSRSSLELAFRQAAFATVAEMDGQVIGYQISTATPVGGHLARLAVSPTSQAKGVGTGLLLDLLTQLRRRSARKVTVNTQENNIASLKLYQKAGFRLTGESYPVFHYSLR
jgi:ribosomal protein S18 acetylase RimI-like enzyme